MSELTALANRMNKFDLSTEKAKDDKVYEAGKLEYENIKRNIRFVTIEALSRIEDSLNENGLKVYNRYYKKVIDAMIAESKQKRRR